MPQNHSAIIEKCCIIARTDTEGQCVTTLDGKRTMLAYLDEAGSTYFGEGGTKRFFYTALVLAGDGFPLHRALLECRYSIISSHGRFSNSHQENDYFHATEDSLPTRERVFGVLKEHAADARVYSVVVEKGGIDPERQTQAGLFEHAASALIRCVIESEDVTSNYDQVCFMLDKIPVQKRRHAILGSLKRTLRQSLEGTGVGFSVMSVASKSDLALQAVDYFSWALYRKWETGDPSQLERLGDNIEVIGPDDEAGRLKVASE